MRKQFSNIHVSQLYKKVAWPSGLRRWFKAPVSSGAWVRIPPLPKSFLPQGTSVRMILRCHQIKSILGISQTPKALF